MYLNVVLSVNNLLPCNNRKLAGTNKQTNSCAFGIL